MEKCGKTKRLYRVIFVLIVGIGLLIHMKDQNLAGFVNSISYFTILSNIMCFCVLLYSAVKRNAYASKRFNLVYGGALLSITLTFFVYSFVLANSDFTMRAMENVTFDNGDILVHYLVPAIMWVDFLWIMPHRIFLKEYITKWLIIPVIYFIITMIKAYGYNYFNVSDEFKRYPYDFLNIEVNGVPYLISYVGLFTLLCIGIGIGICVLDFVRGMIYTKKVCANTKQT